jgi:hypothetical protein
MGCKSAIGYAFKASQVSSVCLVGMKFFVSVVTLFFRRFRIKFKFVLWLLPRKEKWLMKIESFKVSGLRNSSLFMLIKLLFGLFEIGNSHVLKNTVLRSTMRQTTFHS